MADETSKGGLFDPDNFGAGGFFDDVDGEVVSAEVNTWDEAPDKCFVILGLKKDEDGPDAEIRKEYYTIGDLDKFAPSKDHTRPVYDDGTKMNGNTKWAMLVKSLINAGFPKAKITDDVRFIVGVRAHFNLVSLNIKADSPKFKGKKKEGGPSVLVITKLNDGPSASGTAPAAGKKANTATAGNTTKAVAPAAAAAGGGAAEDKAIEVILEKLGESGELAKRNLPNIMFQNIKDVELRKVAMRLAGDSAWLGSEERPWQFDEGSGTLTMGQ